MRVESKRREAVEPRFSDSEGGLAAISLHVRALSRLHELAMMLARMSEPQPALQAILETLVEVHSADFGLLSLFNSATQNLSPAASFGFDEVTLAALANVPTGPNEGACGSAFATRERVIIEDVETDARFECYVALARESGFRAVHSTPILTQKGDVLGVLSVHFKRVRRPTDTETQLADLCARHAAEAMEVAKSRRALGESEMRFARFMQHLPGLAWIKDEAGRYVFANAAAQKAFQVSASELYGKTDSEVFVEDTAGQFQANDQLALANEAGIQTVETLEHEDGTLHFSLVNKFPIRGVDGSATLIGGMAIDVTDRKRAEDSLRESEQRFRNMADHAPVMIWVTEADGSCSFLGKTWYEFTGRSPADSLGFGWVDAVHPDDRENCAERILVCQCTAASALA